LGPGLGEWPSVSLRSHLHTHGEKGTQMTESTDRDIARRVVPSAAKGAARRKRVPGGRPNAIKLRLTDAEQDALTTRAAAAHRSIQRFLVETALADHQQAPRPNATLTAELTSLRRLVSNLANNMNQIARRLNSGGHPDGRLPATTEMVRRAMTRLDAALEAAGSPRPRITPDDPARQTLSRYRSPLPESSGP
jgi:uncharacterized protein (DUF1778 family)